MVSPLTSTTVEILESPLPPAPAASTVLTPLQWKTLLALADTVIPSIRPRSAAVCPGACTISDAEFALATHTLQSVQNDFAHSDIAVQFLAENASSVPEFKESMCRVLGQQIPDEARRGISVILNALNSRPVALALTGYAAPIQCQPYPVREAIFRGWATSVLPPIRSLYRSLIALFHKAWVPLSPTLPAIIGFPRVPVNFTPVEGYPYEFMQFPPGDNTEAIMTDVVIIGSGCGAAVAAKNIAEAGHNNTGNQEHNCGHCTLGCGSCGKKGPQVTFLADAARAGAQFIEGFHAERILFKEGNAGNCLAHAIEGTWTSRDLNRGISGKPVITRKVVIKAKKVIVACGSLQSPLLLLRSGLKNPQIGRNLYLHPVVLLSAVFGEEMKPWEGAILTAVINEFEELDGRGHGAKIETVTTVPSFFLPVFPWTNGLEYKRFVSKLRNMAGFITVTRERYGGRVYPDPVDGRCRISYTPSLFDRKNMIEAIIGAAKVAYVCGAQEIYTSSRDIPSFIRPERSATDTCGPEAGINHAAFQAWIKKVRHTYSPLSPEHTVFASAHQMGTCRMGTSPKSSVVSPSGKVWGTEGLYVADASVFPSASGVNPMVTNMAISDWTTQNILKVLHSERTPANPRL
ncbi:long chain fatty acid oxidase [Histoplasma capsulatum G186AR]|uniref:Long chain fatty acid oxidase n=1 Tax=Ajellomyces capsulatus (strain G186AR / H82 / ATCC MYA-2454 / RMSCC 2432) TaxID=447093 RepID=C0NEB8_AJECG|nr:long chain fatty acid oxidase [Histoplasma capsulatum G186AR]EEH09589.1 long chain fatty acid oxidase [Histoplasma capsulatum G186AR]